MVPPTPLRVSSTRTGWIACGGGVGWQIGGDKAPEQDGRGDRMAAESHCWNPLFREICAVTRARTVLGVGVNTTE